MSRLAGSSSPSLIGLPTLGGGRGLSLRREPKRPFHWQALRPGKRLTADSPPTAFARGEQLAAEAAGWLSGVAWQARWLR